MSKPSFFRSLFLGAGLCAALLVTGCGNQSFPGAAGSLDQTSPTSSAPNNLGIRQFVLIANGNSGTAWANNATTVANTANNTSTSSNVTPLPATTATGTPGSVTLFSADLSVDINGNFNPTGQLLNLQEKQINSGNFGLATSWAAITPNQQFIYTIQGVQGFPQQVANVVVPPGANVTVPPMFNTQFIGDDTLVPLGFLPNASTPLVNLQLPFTILGFPTATRAFGVFVHPTGRFMYITENGFVEAFKIEPNGDLTSIGRFATANGTTTAQFAKMGAFTAGGDYLYVTCASGHLAAFKVDQATGTLSLINIYTTGAGTLGLTLDRTKQKFVYAVNQQASTVSGYSIDLATGALTPLNNFPLAIGGGNFPAYIAASPNRDTIYMTNQGNSTPFQTAVNQTRVTIPPTTGNFLSCFTVDPNTGGFTLIENEINGLGMRNMRNVAVDTRGNFVYVTNAADPFPYDLFNAPAETRGTFGGSIVIFRINSDGSVSFNGSPTASTAAFTDPNSIQIFDFVPPTATNP